MALVSPSTRRILHMFFAACLPGLAILNGCAVEAAPELLDVREVGPVALEGGATLALSGAGFPERQAGVVVIVGSTFTPARQARAVRLSWPALAASRSRVEVELPEKLLASLTQGAPHVTFRGKLIVEFAAPRVKGPLLRGESGDVVLDFFDRRAERPAATDAPSFSSFLGLGLSDGLEVLRIDANSEAARAGLMPGDHLLALDGVRLDALDDFLPIAGADVSSLEFSRPGHRESATTVIDRSDYQPLAISAASEALMVVLSALLALVLAAHPPRWLVWLGARRPLKRRGLALGRTGFASSFEFACFLSLVLGLWLVLGRIQLPLLGSGWFDLELLVALGFVSLLIASFLAGGRRSSRKGFAVWAACRGAFGSLVLLVPALVAIVLRASETGSLRLADLGHAQGAGPFEWALLESPWSLLLGLGFLGSLVPVFGRRPPAEGRGARMRSNGPVADGLAWLGLVVLTGVWVVLLMGGTPRTTPASWLAGVVLSVKLALALAAVFGLRRAVGQLRTNESFGFWGPGLFACTCAGAGLFALSLYVDAFDTHLPLLRQGVTLLAVSSLVLLGLSASRTLGHTGRSADPWI